MEPIDCIRSATTVAADTIGMEGVGRLEPGSWGDVIGVRGDPVADLSLLAKPENIQLVLKAGEVIKSLQNVAP
jgi:imidazolonepropionase-like amidohydrolase